MFLSWRKSDDGLWDLWPQRSGISCKLPTKQLGLLTINSTIQNTLSLCVSPNLWLLMSFWVSCQPRPGIESRRVHTLLHTGMLQNLCSFAWAHLRTLTRLGEIVGELLSHSSAHRYAANQCSHLQTLTRQRDTVSELLHYHITDYFIFLRRDDWIFSLNSGTFDLLDLGAQKWLLMQAPT